MTVMNKKEDRLFEQAMEKIDLKYVEEPPEHGIKRTKVTEPAKRSGIRAGWLIAAAAALVVLVTGGVILANPDIFRKDKEPKHGETQVQAGYDDPTGKAIEQETIPGMETDDSSWNLEGPQDETVAPVFQSPGVVAFGILYTEFLDEQVIEKSNDPLKKAFFKDYAGSYLDDNGDLFVLYKETGEDAAMKVKSMIKEEAGFEVTFLPAKHSLQDLDGFKKQFSDVAMTWSTNGHENWTEALIGVGIDQKNNCLRVDHTYLPDSELAQMKASLAGIPCEFVQISK